MAIIGAGVTGLALGAATSAPVFEAADGPGGLCRTYYMAAGDPEVRYGPDGIDDAYRFEVGGGHWIFGGDESDLEYLDRFATFRRYQRRASVRLGALGLTVDYPIQAHIDSLGSELADAVRSDWAGRTAGEAPRTLEGWLQASFGPTLFRIFFGPFHDRYTAGLTPVIAAQDSYKSPRGTAKGYNTEFRYPVGGLGAMIAAMASHCDIRFGKQVVGIDPDRRRLTFSDGSEHAYDRVLSTLPLDQAVAVAGIRLSAPADPHTSVLVLNIGAHRHPGCPDVHWQYEPDSDSGFHRIGFYSNVEPDFLPRRPSGPARVSLYVERAFPGGAQFPLDIEKYAAAVVSELQDRDYIGDAEVVHPNWVGTAYTWSYPESGWRQTATEALAGIGVEQVGRYGRWHFQGIAESVGEGRSVGHSLHP